MKKNVHRCTRYNVVVVRKNITHAKKKKKNALLFLCAAHGGIHSSSACAFRRHGNKRGPNGRPLTANGGFNGPASRRLFPRVHPSDKQGMYSANPLGSELRLHAAVSWETHGTGRKHGAIERRIIYFYVFCSSNLQQRERERSKK